jgi:hypothetical protein
MLAAAAEHHLEIHQAVWVGWVAVVPGKVGNQLQAEFWAVAELLIQGAVAVAVMAQHMGLVVTQVVLA